MRLLSPPSNLTFLHLIFSQFEEKFEEINGGPQPSPNLPSSSSYNESTPATVKNESRYTVMEMQEQENHWACLDANDQQDFVGGIMKIVPEVDVSSFFSLFSHVEKVFSGLKMEMVM